MEPLGNSIKTARKMKKLTTTELAKLVGVSQGYISHLENNRKNKPSLDILKDLSTALDISLVELMTDTGYLDETNLSDIIGSSARLEGMLNNEYIVNLKKAIETGLNRKNLSLKELSQITLISIDKLDQVENNGKTIFTDNELLSISTTLDYPFIFLFLLAHNLKDVFGVEHSNSFLESVSVLGIQQTRKELIEEIKDIEHLKPTQFKTDDMKVESEKLYGRLAMARKRLEQLTNIVRLDNIFITAAFSNRDSVELDLTDILAKDEIPLSFNGKQLSHADKKSLLKHLKQIEM